MEPVLLVEDKSELRAMLRKFLEREGYTVDEAPDGNTAVDKVRKSPLPAGTHRSETPRMLWPGRAARSPQSGSALPVILITAYGSVEEAVTAMKEGAFDFIQKPVDLEHLALLLQRAARQQELLRENLLLREEYAARYGFPRIVGEHPSMQEASQMVQRVAATDATVLLLGESGTGKELFARAVHHLSPRRDQPFVALNCAAIPEGLVENELFGHERGAYTGAGNRKIGKMELASRGTLFLDEIGELPLAVQGKLLRVLEERQFERVGGTISIDVNLRIVVATNRDLHGAVADKLFREDLYFRISAVPVTVPPLRSRGSDILSARRAFSGKIPARVSQAGAGAFAAGPGDAGKLRLAGQRARIAKRHRTRRDPFQRPSHRTLRFAVAHRQARRGENPHRHAARGISVGWTAGGCLAARAQLRRAAENSKRPARTEVEQDPRRRTAGRLLQNPAQ
jgi:DNA-binding NtrC family response regulator